MGEERIDEAAIEEAKKQQERDALRELTQAAKDVRQLVGFLLETELLRPTLARARVFDKDSWEHFIDKRDKAQLRQLGFGDPFELPELPASLAHVGDQLQSSEMTSNLPGTIGSGDR